MVEVYLRKNIDPNLIFEEDLKIVKEDYEKVAEIEDGNELLDGIYHKTQNQQTNWTRQEDIRLNIKKRKCRSSCIGDIFSVKGQLYLVVPFGYLPLEWGSSVRIKPDCFNKPDFQKLSLKKQFKRKSFFSLPGFLFFG